MSRNDTIGAGTRLYCAGMRSHALGYNKLPFFRDIKI